MQRYPAASCGGGVNNSVLGVPSARDTARSDSFPSSNFSLNPRRQLQLAPYKLKCDKEPLNSRLGPPDFYPQTPNCPEETLTKEYLQSGYRETVEGIEESREIILTQTSSLSKPINLKCREAIRKRHRAINESRAQKRKAGQVYGEPLTGQLLLKPGVFPEQRPCGEDFRKKWIEGLSQQHKRLLSLADHVPHGYRRKSLFEVLIRHNVPLLRATWFIKVTYLNQVRPASGGVSSGSSDKTQITRTELWTKDVIEYLQILWDEFFPTHSNVHGRDHSQQTLLASSIQHKADFLPTTPDGEEPGLQFKWMYMVRIVEWHHAEGLLLPSAIIEWVLNQLQEKESQEALQLLLPIVFDMIESVCFSQTYVRILVDIAVRFIQDGPLSGPDTADNPSRQHVVSSLIKMLQYLMFAVPDTFVGLDCFPLPPQVFFSASNPRNLLSKDSANVHSRTVESINKHDTSFEYVASSLQKRASSLAIAVNPGILGSGMAKIVQILDRTLIYGDVRGAYNCLFENLSDGGIDEGWIAEVSPCLRSSLRWFGTVNLSVICSVFLLCEWATCDFRDCRSSLDHDVKFTGRKDFSQVYVAVLLLKLRMEDMQNTQQSKSNLVLRASNILKCVTTPNDSFSGGISAGNGSSLARNNMRGLDGCMDSSDLLQSPGPLHDIVVCWLDQHEISKGEGFTRLQMLIVELVRLGIFYPPAYVRQLIICGIMDRTESLSDLNRRKRHLRILKQFSASHLFDVLKESKVVPVPLLSEALRVYSNERQLVLHGPPNGKSIHSRSFDGSSVNPASVKQNDIFSSNKKGKRNARVTELKAAISMQLHFPTPSSTMMESHLDVSQGTPMKRPISSSSSVEATPGCEECKRSKKQKTTEEKSSFPLNPSDDEDTWWVRKAPAKTLESSVKVDQPKANKQASRGRQKIVRKTQSLAQLAAARIEGSQGASTSHVCDSKVSCPHHRTSMDLEVSKSLDGIKMVHDAVTIGRALKQLRLLEKKSVALWLVTTIERILEGSDKVILKGAQSSGMFSSTGEDKNSERWRLGEDELSFILYLLDICSDLLSVAKFLLWLLPKVQGSPVSSVHGGRNLLMLPKNTEGQMCEVGESFLLSALRRYENVLVAADLLPEALSALMRRAEAAMGSSGRPSSSAAFIYARNLLKKYGSVGSVSKWEKSYKVACDQRLLAELELGRPLDSELGFSPVSIPTGVEDVDEYFRQKISSRISRAGPTMKEIVQRHIEEAMHYFYNKERKLFASPPTKSSVMEKSDDGYQCAQQIVLNLVDCVRQNGGAAQEPDPSVVAAAISAVVGNVGPAIAKMPDFSGTSNYPPSFSSNMTSLSCARRIIHVHITCLFLLKEALGGRQSRVFEIAVAGEAFSCISTAIASGKSQSRSQFQLAPDTHESNLNLSNDILNNSTKVFLGRATRVAAAVSALVVGIIVHGIVSLDRMITCFKLKEGLDVLQLIRGTRSNANGVSRSMGAYKVENGIDVYLHWFRLLIGNCRMVSDGLVMELLGEPYALALSRMQRMLPLNLVFPPAYSIFGLVIWRPYIINSNLAPREDIQLHQSLLMAINEIIRHQPFRDLLLRDTHTLYELLACDMSDSEFAAMLELHSPDKQSKIMAFVPLRARLFLNSILECRMPLSAAAPEGGSWVSGNGDTKVYPENETKLLDQLVHILDTIQSAKFHWQWVELRLLLNEQVLMEKIEAHNMSLVEAVRSLSPSSDNCTLSEHENNFTEIVLTRLLVRPDAAPLYSEVVHLLGRSMEESLLMPAKWFLAGSDVLLGRKSIRQRLVNVAQLRGLSTRAQFWKPWGWSGSTGDSTVNRQEKRKFETSLEEGEVVEEGTDLKRPGKTPQLFENEGCISSDQFVTERALVQLVLPCIDRSSSDSRNTFASELIKQMNTIEQHINGLTRGSTKQPGSMSASTEVGPNKGSTRKGIRGGSPGLGRRPTGMADSAISSAAALRASMWLRLQFLLRLLPIICADREPSARNMRHMLASILLRLLGTRVVYEDADLSFFPVQRQHYPSKREREIESSIEISSPASMDLAGDSLFDRFLWVLHGLLSSGKPSWLKPLRSSSKSSVKSPRDFSAFDRDIAESLQAELDQMRLPAALRRRLQAAMPMLSPSLPTSISCQPPAVTAMALAQLQSSILITSSCHGVSGVFQRSIPLHSSRAASSIFSVKGKPLPPQETDLEMDPWLLLEDGTGSGPISGNSNMGASRDHVNLKASGWLRGSVRVKRTDLTYIGPVDDDS